MGSEWKEIQLQNIVSKLGDGLHGTPKYSPNGSYYFINGNNLDNGSIVLKKDTKRVSFSEYEKHKKTLNNRTLLVSINGTIGNVAYYNNEPVILGKSACYFNLNEDVSRGFVRYVLLSSAFLHYLESYSTGTTIKNVSLKMMREFSFRLPPLPEQKAIAHILGSLDDKIELNRRMNETLEGMAQALFKSWFVDFDPVLDNALAAGNPIPDELAECAEVRRQVIVAGSANREAAKAFPAAFQSIEELGWIPEGWKVRPIIEHIHLTMGQSPSSDYYNKDGNGLPFHQGVTNYGERFPKHVQYSTGGNRYAEKGDILFSVRAPVGRINISDCRIIIGRGLSALRHKQNHQGFLAYFLKYTFQKEDSIGSGTIFNSVNKKDMESISYLAPTDGLAKTFNNIANSFDEKIASNAVQTQALENLRDTLLPKLISGELRIPDAEKLAEEALT